MTPAQAFALAHPIENPHLTDFAPYRLTRRHGGTKLLLQAILAVDR